MQEKDPPYLIVSPSFHDTHANRRRPGMCARCLSLLRCLACWTPLQRCCTNFAGKAAQFIPRELIRPPVLRVGEQAARSREITTTETFFDLIFFLPLQTLCERQLQPESLVAFWVYYAAIFNTWIGTVFYNTRFDTDDTFTQA